ncbi:MAG: transcription elongation factor GreA [Bdellovibrionales bacterium]|nr:transcription elongation factor GreA [Bdellovibrionales bacterium]
MQRIPMTAYGKAKLVEELNLLKTVERPRIVKEIEEARAHGDLKENAEYHAAKDKQGHIEGRIRFLEDQLSRCEVIDTSRLGTEKVVFGVTVKLFDIDSDKELQYRIVGDIETDATKGHISINSPIARALIGKQVGDVAIVQAPGGQRELEVVEITVI